MGEFNKDQLAQEVRRLQEQLNRVDSQYQDAVNALRQSKQCFQQIFRNTTLGIAQVSLSGCFERVNPAFCSLLGYSETELVGKHIREVTHPEDILESVRKQKQIAAGTIDRFQLKKKYLHRKGHSVEALLTADVIRDSQAEPLYYISSIVNLSEALHYQTRLQESEAQFQQLFESVPIGLYRTTPDGRWTEVNSALVEMLGYPTKESLLKVNVSVLYVDSQVEEQWLATIEESSEVREHEIQLYRRDGSTIWVLDSTRAVRDQQGQITAFEGGMQDLSLLKQAEATIRESEGKYRGFFQTSQHGVFITNLNGEWLECNQAAVELFGYESKAELYQVNTADLYVNPQKREQHIRQLRKHGQTKDFYSQLFKKDGTIIDTLISATHYEKNGEIAGYQGTIRDITNEVNYTNEIKQKTAQVTAIREIGLHLASELDPDQLIPIIIKKALSLVNADAGSLNLLTADGNALEMVYQSGHTSLPENTAVKLGQGLIGNVWIKEKAIRVRDYAKWVLNLPEWVEHFGHKAVVGIPVKHHGRLIGVLEILRENEQPFTRDETWLLELFASQAAVSLSNARLFEDSQKQLRRMQSLHEIDLAIKGNLDLSLTLEILLDRLLRHLKIDAGNILLYRPKFQHLTSSASAGFREPDQIHQTIKLGEDLAGRAVLDRKLVHIPDLTKETLSTMRSQLIRKENFRTYFAVPLIAKGKVLGVLEVFHRSLFQPSPEWTSFLETLAGQAAIAIENLTLFENLQATNLDLTRTIYEVIATWAESLTLRSCQPEGISQRLETLTVKICREMGINDDQLNSIRYGALLHDIGIISIPDDLCAKEGKLSCEEREIIEKHPAHAYHLLTGSEPLRQAAVIPYHHHEKWDGSGYPQGLKGEEIPLAARIFAVVEAWEKMRTDHAQQKAWPDGKVRDYIREKAGKDFDPAVVEVFFREVDSA